jgi:hypothetical protein
MKKPTKLKTVLILAIALISGQWIVQDFYNFYKILVALGFEFSTFHLPGILPTT